MTETGNRESRAAARRASSGFGRAGSLLLVTLATLLVPVATAQAPVPISFAEMYGRATVRGLELSDVLLDNAGGLVEMIGYMAPPLKAELDFFVLTRVPLAVCPFCDDASSWPPDIVFIRLPAGQTARATGALLRVTGTLEVGPATDEETGFVSLVRIIAEAVEPVR